MSNVTPKPHRRMFCSGRIKGRTLTLKTLRAVSATLDEQGKVKLEWQADEITWKTMRAKHEIAARKVA